MKKTVLRTIVLAHSIIFIFLGIEYDLYRKAFQEITTKVVLWSVVTIVLSIQILRALEEEFPVLKFSLKKFISKKNTIASRRKKLLSSALLLVTIPPVAYAEEYVFRLGTVNDLEGIVRNILFALLHFVLFFSVSQSIVIFLVGLWFTHWYFVGGIELSTAYHTAQNYIATIIGVIFILIKKEKVKPECQPDVSQNLT